MPFGVRAAIAARVLERGMCLPCRRVRNAVGAKFSSRNIHEAMGRRILTIEYCLSRAAIAQREGWHGTGVRFPHVSKVAARLSGRISVDNI